MTRLEIIGLSEPSWSIDRVHLSEGYWVLLVGDQQMGNELARRIVGLDAPSKGTVLLNGERPFRSPRARATCVSVQMSETRAAAAAVSGCLTRQGGSSDGANDAVEMLKSFGLEHLANRRYDTLCAQERRQLAFATAALRRNIQLAVYCEPCLDLSEPQLARLQDHMSQLAARACVICITASLHDARQLGGPHAQLTRSGWSWVTTGADPGCPIRLLVEGTGLRPVAAHLALLADVSEVRMIQESDAQMLHVHTNAGSDVTSRIVRVARQNHATVRRICMDESLVLSGSSEGEPVGRGDPSEQVRVSPASQDCNLGRMIWVSQRELLAKTLFSPRGALLVLGQPLITAAYAVGQRQLATADALRQSLAFLITYIVPLGSLLGVRVLNAASALGGLREGHARLGANRRISIASNSAVICATCAAVAAGSAAVAVLLTSETAGADLGTCAWIAALGAATYASILTWIDLLRRYWLQWVYLIINAWLGASALGLSALFPHAHLLNLLGSPVAPDLTQSASVGCLGVLGILAFGLTLVRVEP